MIACVAFPGSHIGSDTSCLNVSILEMFSYLPLILDHVFWCLVEVVIRGSMLLFEHAVIRLQSFTKRFAGDLCSLSTLTQ